MANPDNNLIAGASRVLQERLPPGWAIERVAASGRAARLRITSKEGQSRDLPVSALSRPDPRTARQIPKERPLLVMAPYLSRGVREAIESEGASYVDQTGNVRVVLDRPGLFIVTSGAESNPWPEERRFTLRGTKAGRVVCALARAKPPLGVRELAAAADTDPGYVSRLLGMLDREAIVDRTGRGRVARIDWRKLLLRWSEEAPLESRTTASTWLAARGPGPTSVGPGGHTPTVGGTGGSTPVSEPPPGTEITGFAWTGEVPPQKWMNFYTKVLSRFATAGGLKVTLTVEVDPPGGTVMSKVEETKVALRELGMDEDVEIKVK